MFNFGQVTALLGKKVLSGCTINGMTFFEAQKSICLFPKKASISSTGQFFICSQLLEKDDFFKNNCLALDNVILQLYKFPLRLNLWRLFEKIGKRLLFHQLPAE